MLDGGARSRNQLDDDFEVELPFGWVGFCHWVRQQGSRRLYPSDLTTLRQIVSRRVADDGNAARRLSPQAEASKRYLRSLNLSALPSGQARLRRPVSIPGLVREYRRLTTDVDLQVGEHGAAAYRATLQSQVTRARRNTRRDGAHLGELPTTTSLALAGMTELLRPGRLESAVLTSHRLRTAITRRMDARRDSRDLHIAIRDSSSLWRWRGTDLAVALSITADVVGASQPIVDGLARWTVDGDGAARAAVERWIQTSSRDRRAQSQNGRGLVFDLAELCAEIQREYPFPVADQPQIRWSQRMGLARLGQYNCATDCIELAPELDHTAMPRNLVSFVLYHELLHKARAIESDFTASCRHDAEFNRRERAFNGYSDVAADLELLGSTLLAEADVTTCAGRWRSREH